MYRFQLLKSLINIRKYWTCWWSWALNPLANPIMRNTVGRKVSLKQGSKLEGTPMEKIVRTLEANGYEVVGLD